MVTLSTPAAPARVRAAAHVPTDRELAAVLGMAEQIEASTEPSVVFASLAKVCVPVIGDACIVSISSAQHDPYALVWPPLEPVDATKVRTAVTGHSQPGEEAIFTPIGSRSANRGSCYRGAFTLISYRDRPTTVQALLAQLLVDRAMAIVEQERSSADLSQAHQRADNLETALVSSRTIGMAMGIAMERHRMSSDQAFNLLRRLSQRRHRKLREIADEVIMTGEVELPEPEPEPEPESEPRPVGLPGGPAAIPKPGPAPRIG
ncbi:MAG: ANTAR domain-containing protein [Jatrophihabitantaceae bacterium]